VAPPSGNASRPGRALAALVALIVVMLLAIVGGNIGSPGNWSKDFKVLLGLDLTSGTTVELQAVVPKGHTVTQAQIDEAVQIMENRVNGAGFTGAQVVPQGKDIINVSVPGPKSQSVIAYVEKTAELYFRQVLLVAPNTSSPVPTTPTPSPSGSASPSPSSTASPSPTASTSPTATASPSKSAHAAGLPGTRAGAPSEMARHASTVSATPSPTPTPSTTPSGSASPTPSPTPTSTSGTTTWQEAQAEGGGDASLLSPQVKALFNKLNCADKNWRQQIGYTAEQWDNPKIQIVSCGRGPTGVLSKFALDKSTVAGTTITAAAAQPQQTSTQWQVLVTFNSAGTKEFGDLTTKMFDQYGSSSTPLDDLAVVLDGQVITFPAIKSSITGGQAQIYSFSQSYATYLANVLSYGKLPLSFHQESIQTISPQLGHDQLTAGLLAAALGLILVVLYLLLYYRGLALISVLSLTIAALLAYESVILLGKYQHYTLSLAGIAGLIVAIGITADSFVVFFERLRDEVREGGRSLRAAVERGWTRARRTILVSDTVSFLAAALLYYFALGDVKGFAFTLGLTTIIDVVVVFLFTKPMMTLLARTKFYGGGHPLSGLDPARLGARAPWRGSSQAPPRSRARPAAGSPARASRPSRTAPAKES
jgi:preprotein translocase subunit SecD